MRDLMLQRMLQAEEEKRARKAGPAAVPAKEASAQELRDEIARRCPINRSRQALFGHSFGGLFVLYALAHAPEAFSHWIAASPSIFWEDGSLLPSIGAFEKGSPVCAQLLLLAGAYEAELAPFQQALPAREQRLARLVQREDAAAIVLSDMPVGAKPCGYDGIGGPRIGIDLMQKFESGLQAGGRIHGTTIRLERAAL